MTQAYSDPERADDPHSLPDVEVFYHDASEERADTEPLPEGWYWHACFPGCLPDGEPNGPFETEEEALADASNATDDDESESRFWVTNADQNTADVSDWFGVVDEQAGGIVAYFEVEKHAEAFITLLKGALADAE